jgi:hypothetical protein
MFYWIRSLQTYDDGWNYIDNLKSFVQGGLVDDSFIDAVSGIVNRGCHNPVSFFSIDASFLTPHNYFDLPEQVACVAPAHRMRLPPPLQPCANGSGALDGGWERKENFKKALEVLLEPDGSPRVFRPVEATTAPSARPGSTPTPVLSPVYGDDGAFAEEEELSVEEEEVWTEDEPAGDADAEEEDWTEDEPAGDADAEEEDWTEDGEDWSEATTSTGTAMSLWCGESQANAYTNCNRQGYDCPEGVCFNGLKCFMVGDACEEGEGVDSSSPMDTGAAMSLWCGESQANAYTNCNRQGYDCPDGVCFNGLKCFMVGDACEEGEGADSSSPMDASPSPTPSAGSGATGNNSGVLGQFCAESFDALESVCATAVACEVPDDCPSGTFCWKEYMCGGTTSTTTSPSVATAPQSSNSDSPSKSGTTLASNSPSSMGSAMTTGHSTQIDIAATNLCGIDRVHASTSCHKQCPNGLNEDCDEGETCFAYVTCGAGSSPAPTPGYESSQRPSHGLVMSSSQQPTEEVTMPSSQQPTQGVATSSESQSTVAVQQLFCASTKEDLEVSCVTAQSCISRPCPSTMFCFPFTCAGAVEDDNSTPVSTSQQPTQGAAASSESQLTGAVQQLFCASTKEELEMSCATAQSCISEPCPSKMFCFPFTCAGAVEDDNSTQVSTAPAGNQQSPAPAESKPVPVDNQSLCPQSSFVGWHTSADCKGESSQQSYGCYVE